MAAHAPRGASDDDMDDVLAGVLAAKGTSRARAARKPAPTPATTWCRPNGEIYHPRRVGGFLDVELLRNARRGKEHVLLYGQAGTGKTAMIEAAFAPDATDEHVGLETIVGGADTTEADFLGTFVQDATTGIFTWVPGPLHRSVLYDIPLYVDEIALIDPRVHSLLYAVMDGRGVLRIPMNPALTPLPVGPNWFVIASYNPDVPGAVMSEALLDRFDHHIEVGSDWDLARTRFKIPGNLVTVAKNLDAKRARGALSWSPQLRTLRSFARLEAKYGKDYALANLLSKAPAADRADIARELTAVFGTVTPLRLGGETEAEATTR